MSGANLPGANMKLGLTNEEFQAKLQAITCHTTQKLRQDAKKAIEPKTETAGDFAERVNSLNESEKEIFNEDTAYVERFRKVYIPAQNITVTAAAPGETTVSGSAETKLTESEIDQAIELVCAEAVGNDYLKLLFAGEIAAGIIIARVEELRKRMGSVAPGHYALILEDIEELPAAFLLKAELEELNLGFKDIFIATTLREAERIAKAVGAENISLVINNLAGISSSAIGQVLPNCRYITEIPDPAQAAGQLWEMV